VLADLVRERFGRCIDRRDAAHEPGRTRTLQRLDQTEIGDLDAIGDHEQVSRLDVEVLEPVLLDEVVETLGCVVKESEQDVAWDSRPPGLLVLTETFMEVLVGELHDDEKLAADILNLLDGEDEGMADLLHPFEGFHLLDGASVVSVQGVEVSVDELDRLVDSAGRDALPDFAEAAGSNRFQQPVTRQRFGVRLAEPVHGGDRLLPRRVDGATGNGFRENAA
jgi:hypothetical protein